MAKSNIQTHIYRIEGFNEETQTWGSVSLGYSRKSKHFMNAVWAVRKAKDLKKNVLYTKYINGKAVKVDWQGSSEFRVLEYQIDPTPSIVGIY